MNIRETAKLETRTIGVFIKDKLGCSKADFARAEDIPVSTLNDRWKSDDGRVRVMDTVFRVYIERFKHL